MPALRAADEIPALAAQKCGDSKARTRPDEADHALLRKGAVRPGNVPELSVSGMGDRMSHRHEIVDDDTLFQPQSLRYLRRPYPPRTVVGFATIPPTRVCTQEAGLAGQSMFVPCGDGEGGVKGRGG